MHKIWYCHKNTLEFPDDMKLSNNRRISILYKILNTISNNILIWYAAIIFKKNTVVQCPCHRLIHCTQLRNLWFFPFFSVAFDTAGGFVILFYAHHTRVHYLPTYTYIRVHSKPVFLGHTRSRAYLYFYLLTCHNITRTLCQLLGWAYS